MPLSCLQAYCVSSSLDGQLLRRLYPRARGALVLRFISKLLSYLILGLFDTNFLLELLCQCDIEHHNSFFFPAGGAPSR